jgi:hypothetical protein
MKKYLTILLFTFVAACATSGNLLGPTPEAQIKLGSDTASAAATINTVALKNRKISTATAKSYNDLLHAASGHLHDANTRLEACRKSTGSVAGTRPDPCKATVADDIDLGISIANSVKKTLDAK